MEEKKLLINDNEYVFTYSPDSDRWGISECDVVKGHLLEFGISMKQFPESSFWWEDVAAFISYLRERNSWLVEKIVAAKVPLLALCRAFFKDGIDDEQDRHIDLEAVGIDYKGHRKSITGEREFCYDICYSLYDVRDPYEDMGMFIWRAVFVGEQISGVEFDL